MRTAAGARLGEGAGHCLANSDDVVAVDLLALDAGGDRLLGQGLGRGLVGHRHRYCPAVIVDYEYDRQLPDPGGIERLGDIALPGRPIPEHTDSHPLLMPQLEGQSDADGVRRVGPDRNANREILASLGKIAAALVTAPEQQQLERADVAPQLRALLAEAPQQYI